MVLSMAAESAGLNVSATYYSDICADSLLVAGTLFPEAIPIVAIERVTASAIAALVKKWPDANFLLGGGPPCTDVSLLKSGNAGAMGSKSVLRCDFERVYQYLVTAAGPDRVWAMMECTRMSPADRRHYDAVFGTEPFELCGSWWTPCTRPRWFWLSRQPSFPSGTVVSRTQAGVHVVKPAVQRRSFDAVLLPGWVPSAVQSKSVAPDSFTFSCLTRHNPRDKPMFKPRGIEQCDEAALARWRADDWSQSPYQYCLSNMVVPKPGKKGSPRRLVAVEEESMMGLPRNHTAAVLILGLPPRPAERRRRSLLGIAWQLVLMLTLKVQILRTFGLA